MVVQAFGDDSSSEGSEGSSSYSRSQSSADEEQSGFGERSQASGSAFGESSRRSRSAFGESSRRSRSAFGESSRASGNAFGESSQASVSAFGESSRRSGSEYDESIQATFSRREEARSRASRSEYLHDEITRASVSDSRREEARSRASRSEYSHDESTRASASDSRREEARSRASRSDYSYDESTRASASRTEEAKTESSEKRQCKSIAVLGTMSDVGKSTVAAGLCRILCNNGIRVAPFKAQNMSNNASAALLPHPDRRERLYKSFKKAVGGSIHLEPSKNQAKQGYGEIGTAQALQAEACRLVPLVEMNPVLLKSGGRKKNGEYLCSVVVLGKQIITETYGDLAKRTTSLRKMVIESHQALAEETNAEVVVLEGAGSCTELNLIERDIVNLPLVRELGCHWLLVANIDSGGVFAQIVGTKMCVSERDWSLCVGVIVNKLRGESKYFEPGPKILEKMVGKKIFVVPFLPGLNLPEEDGLGIDRRLVWEKEENPPSKDKKKRPVVVVVAYPHTAIADDVCPLEQDPRFIVQWRRRRIPRPYPHTTAVILPGSRLTRLDLKWMHDSGWGDFLRTHVAAGGSVLGLCGGYQMLGWSVEDPTAVEGTGGSKLGLGLLPISTTIASAACKIVAPRKGRLLPSKIKVEGFELHCGRSEIITQAGAPINTQQIHPLVMFDDGKPEGMGSGKVKGTYLHGILRSAEARVQLLVPNPKDFPGLKKKVKDPLDRVAEHLASCGLDFETLKGMIGENQVEL